MQPTTLVAQVADAFAHLYDLVYLRTHPLTDFVTPQSDMQYKKKAWLLHDVLLRLIEELDPGYSAPPDGREMRRYRLMSLRYSEGMPSKTVADELAISLRHYYREHDVAIAAVAKILWERYSRQLNTGDIEATQPPKSDSEPHNRQAILRAEVAHLQEFDKQVHLGDILAGVMELAQKLTRAKDIRLTLEPLQDATPLPLDRTMVRQILLGLLSYLAEQLAEGEIRVRVCKEGEQQVVEMVGIGPQISATTEHQREEQMATLYELAGLQSAHLRLSIDTTGGIGFRLWLPRMPRQTVLLVDDNGDVLELYQRYLQQGYYQAVPAQTGHQALQLARELQPQVIVLDLMLPEQDGWEILQRLANHPDTQGIPVVICSILRARQLAMALGAAAFLEKPVNEAEFLTALSMLTEGQDLS